MECSRNEMQLGIQLLESEHVSHLPVNIIFIADDICSAVKEQCIECKYFETVLRKLNI